LAAEIQIDNPPPKLAVVGGSQAYALLQQKKLDGERLDRVDTPFGASQPVYRICCEEGEYFFMSRHGEKEYNIGPSFVNYRANIYALKELGAEHVVAWNATGAVNTELRVGQFVLVDDVLDETKNRESTFFRFKGLGFIRQDAPFCPTLRNGLRAVLADMSLDFVDRATYACMEGPRLETRAEVRKLAAVGADLVGMTLCPEVFLARELEMCYVSLCYVTNYAEGLKERPYKPGRRFNGLATRRELRHAEATYRQLPEILARLVSRLRREKRVCRCQEAMKHYKKRGDIGDNWREWMKP